MEWTDLEAAAETRKGNQNGFRVLVERHSRFVFRLTLRMTGNEQDAEDLVQETFLRAYKQIHRFDGRASFGTWIYRIAANCSLDLIRARKNRNEQPVTTNGDETICWLDSLAAPEPSPERLTQSGQIAELLGPAMRQLSDMERSAFVLRHYEGLGIEDVANALGVQPGAARHSIFRAVRKLRRALECHV